MNLQSTPYITMQIRQVYLHSPLNSWEKRKVEELKKHRIVSALYREIISSCPDWQLAALSVKVSGDTIKLFTYDVYLYGFSWDSLALLVSKEEAFIQLRLKNFNWGTFWKWSSPGCSFIPILLFLLCLVYDLSSLTLSRSYMSSLSFPFTPLLTFI